MSEKKANFIKFISFIGGFLGAAICVCLGLKTMETDMVTSVLLFLLSAVFLILIYPLYQIGKLGNEVNEQSKKIRVLAKKQTKQKHTVRKSCSFHPDVKEERWVKKIIEPHIFNALVSILIITGEKSWMKTWLEVKSIGVLNYHKSNISMPWEWINLVKYMTERSKQRQVWKMLLYFHGK